MKNEIVPVSRLMKQLKNSMLGAAADLRREAGRHAEREGKGNTVTCVSGCAHCCYQKVLVSAAEGLAIYLHLRMNNRWNEVEKERLANFDRLMTDQTHAYWFNHKMPCAFLAEEKSGWGKCSVYEARPMSCAATFSVSGDPKLCSQDNSGDPQTAGGQIQVVGKTQSMMDYFSVLLAFQGAVDPGPDDIHFMTLPGAVLYAAASIENQPLPNVRRVKLDKPGHVTEEFDEVAIHRT